MTLFDWIPFLLWFITGVACFVAWPEYGHTARRVMGGTGFACVVVAFTLVPIGGTCEYCTAWWCCLIGCPCW
jgi:hypothetical protein